MSNTVHYKETVKVEIDIRRPNGAVETVDITSKYRRLNDAAFAIIRKNTKDAGRGDVLAYRNIEADAEYIKNDVDLIDDHYTAVIKMQKIGC